MKKVLLAVLMAVSFGAVAGNCNYPDDIAADGSICGGRAASVRPGGEVPPPEDLPVMNDLTSVNSDTIVTTNNGYTNVNSVQMGVNTYPDNVEFKCNGDLNINLNAGRYSSSVETSEVPENWYGVSLVAHNHYLGEMSHTIAPNGNDDFKFTVAVDSAGNGFITIGNFPRVWEYSTLKVIYVNGKAVSASLKGDDFNYQCKRIDVENPWKA